MDAEEPNLPEWINHRAHSLPNRLVLRQYRWLGNSTASRCRVCLNDLKEGDPIYACETSYHYDCDFVMDMACSYKALVDFRGHKHPLYLLEQVHPDYRLECCSCGMASNKLIFSCPQLWCGYSLHLLCGPLPIAIPYHYAGYDMNLTLKDTLLNGVDAEDSWCDICEQKRPPGQCVYRSEDPLFTASIDCVLPQIVSALKGDFGEVRLRSVRQHIPGSVLPFTAQGFTEEESSSEEESSVDDDPKGVEDFVRELEHSVDVANNIHGTYFKEQIVESLTEEDKKQLKRLKLKNLRGIVIPFKFSNEAFELFEEYFAIKGVVDLSFEISWLKEEDMYIKVGDNLVVSELAPLYRQVVDKYGDITAESPLSRSGRATCLWRFLNTVNAMQGLQIFETTADFLCSWQCFLEVVCNELGFSIQFALDNLEKAARACYALKFIKVRDGITSDLTRTIQQLERDINDDKPRLEALRSRYGRAKKESAFGNQCPLKISKLQWKNAGDFLGLDPEE